MSQGEFADAIASSCKQFGARDAHTMRDENYNAQMNGHDQKSGNENLEGDCTRVLGIIIIV